MLLFFPKSTCSAPSKSLSFDSLHRGYNAQHLSLNASVERCRHNLFSKSMMTNYTDFSREKNMFLSDSLSWETINRLPRRKRDGSSSCLNRITYSALMPWLLKASITDVTWATAQKTWANKGVKVQSLNNTSERLLLTSLSWNTTCYYSRRQNMYITKFACKEYKINGYSYKIAHAFLETVFILWNIDEIKVGDGSKRLQKKAPDWLNWAGQVSRIR